MSDAAAPDAAISFADRVERQILSFCGEDPSQARRVARNPKSGAIELALGAASGRLGEAGRGGDAEAFRRRHRGSPSRGGLRDRSDRAAGTTAAKPTGRRVSMTEPREEPADG